MTVTEANKILSLDPGASIDEVEGRYRSLMSELLSNPRRDESNAGAAQRERARLIGSAFATVYDHVAASSDAKENAGRSAGTARMEQLAAKVMPWGAYQTYRYHGDPKDYIDRMIRAKSLNRLKFFLFVCLLGAAPLIAYPRYTKSLYTPEAVVKASDIRSASDLAAYVDRTGTIVADSFVFTPIGEQQRHEDVSDRDGVTYRRLNSYNNRSYYLLRFGKTVAVVEAYPNYTAGSPAWFSFKHLPDDVKDRLTTSGLHLANGEELDSVMLSIWDKPDSLRAKMAWPPFLLFIVGLFFSLRRILDLNQRRHPCRKGYLSNYFDLESASRALVRDYGRSVMSFRNHVMTPNFLVKNTLFSFNMWPLALATSVYGYEVRRRMTRSNWTAFYVVVEFADDPFGNPAKAQIRCSKRNMDTITKLIAGAVPSVKLRSWKDERYWRS